MITKIREMHPVTEEEQIELLAKDPKLCVEASDHIGYIDFREGSSSHTWPVILHRDPTESGKLLHVGWSTGGYMSPLGTDAVQAWNLAELLVEVRVLTRQTLFTQFGLINDREQELPDRWLRGGGH